MPEPLAPKPLVGRVAERQTLRDALHDAAAGRGAMIVIEGEAGIGKSRLASDALDEARTLGIACFAASAGELDRHRPFGPVADALILGRELRPTGASDARDAPEVVSLTTRLAGLVSGETDGAGTFLLTGAPEAEFRIIDELIDLIELRCRDRPLLLVLEDLHWADPSTLLALNRLLREIPALPCAIVATMRPPALSAGRRSPREQLAARGARHLRLNRLSEEEISTLVYNLLGVPPGPRLLAQLRRAGGNPFFATELVDALERGGAILRYGGIAELTGGECALPESVGNAIVHRVSFISEEILETLQVASILGSVFSVTDLAVSTGRNPAALGPQLAAAVRAGILGEDGTRLAFRHDLIREVLYQRMDPALRSWLHLAIAHVLVEHGHPREEVAGHVARGARPGDQNASELLRTAARDVASRSPSVAAELLDRAIEVAPAESLHRAAARADLASYHLQAGRLADAESICRELISAGIDPSLEGQVRCCLIEAMIGQGRLAEGLAEVEAAIGSAALSDSHRARLLSLASTCQAATWDPEGARTSATRALRAAEQAGDEIACGVALSNLSVASTLIGDFGQAVALAEAGLARASAGVDQRAQPFLPVLTLASALVDADRPGDAQQLLERWRRLRLSAGAGWNHPVDHIISGIGRFWSGDWDEALVSLTLGFDIGETTGVRRAAVAGRAVASLIALHRGDLATAEHEVAVAEADYEGSGPQWRAGWMLWARALKTEAEGRRADALRTLVKAWELCVDAGVLGDFPVIGPDLVRLALACGEELRAEEATVSLESLAAHAEVPGVQGAALRCRGLVNADPAILLEAVAAYRMSPRRRALGLTCEDAAIALVRETTKAGRERAGRLGSDRGRQPRKSREGAQNLARDLAEEALAIFGALDARRDLARAHTRLTAARLSWSPAPRASARRTPSRSVGSGAAAAGRATNPPAAPMPDPLRETLTGMLTPTEAQVASHVAQGLSNPQIARLLGVSPRTVQTHVSNAMRKLGLGSRVELAVWTSAMLSG